MSGGQSILVMGGTGFVGEGLARFWKEADTPLTFLVHRTRPDWLDELGLSHAGVDLRDASSIRRAVGDSRTVINLLRPLGNGWYPKVLDVVLPALQSAGVLRFVHASTIDVYNGSAEVQVSSATSAAPRTAYEIEHVDAELRIRKLFDEPAILRLGAVFGAGGKNIVALADEMANSPRYKLVLRRALYGSRRMHLVSLPTVCGAIEAAALADQAAGVINVTDDNCEQNNFGVIQDMLARSFGRRGLSGIPSAPAFVLSLALRLRGLSPVLARRRFSSDGLDRLGSIQGDFITEVERYGYYLAQQSRGHAA